MIRDFLKGANALMFLSERLDRLTKGQAEFRTRLEKLEERTNGISDAVVKLSTRLEAREQMDEKDWENLILRLRLELSEFRHQLPPLDPPAGGSQTCLTPGNHRLLANPAWVCWRAFFGY